MNIFRRHDDKESKQELKEMRFPNDLLFLEGYSIDAVDAIRDRFGYCRIDFLCKKGVDFQHLVVKINQDGDRMTVENETAFLKEFYKGVNYR